MADDATDTLFGFILFILFLALIGYAAGSFGSSSSTAGTAAGSSQSLPPLAGSEVPSCSDKFTLEQNKSDSSTSPSLNLKVWVDPMDSGRKCATATEDPTVELGTVKVTLAYTADKTQMVSGRGDQTASVQVSGTDNFCVSALAEIIGTSIKVTIPKVIEPCAMTAPAMQPASPKPVFPADDKEEEEGY